MSAREAALRIQEAVDESGRHYRDSLPMIASENILSPLVRKACDSDLHGRYAEGLPGKRYYQGCDDFDTIEEIGIAAAQRVFDCNFANIQSTSGTVSNIAGLKALAKPGDTITAVSTADGGHISHARMGAVGLRGLNLVTYPWVESRMEPDIDAAADLIRETEPNLALFGQSVFLFPTPLEEQTPGNIALFRRRWNLGSSEFESRKPPCGPGNVLWLLPVITSAPSLRGSWN